MPKTDKHVLYFATTRVNGFEVRTINVKRSVKKEVKPSIFRVLIQQTDSVLANVENISQI